MWLAPATTDAGCGLPDRKGASMTALASNIERQIENQAGIHVAVEEDRGQVVLTGMVGSDELRAAALEIAAEMAGSRPVIDNLMVPEAMPADVMDMELSEMETSALEGATPDLREDGALEPGDFTDEGGITDAWSASGPTSAIEYDLVSEGDEVFTPPTDPVGNNTEVIGGLQLSSMDDVSVEASALDGTFGDEAIADAVRRELREDAATTDFRLDVSVREGVVRLRGGVPLIEDTDNAAEVASRVPGVVEVVDELEIRGL